jgi:hypothetical protein
MPPQKRAAKKATKKAAKKAAGHHEDKDHQAHDLRHAYEHWADWRLCGSP